MINELKKTYELLPKQPEETGRYLTVNETPFGGYKIRLEIFFSGKPELRSTYIVTFDELKIVNFDYEDNAITTLCHLIQNHL
ncbi:hypothetical protein [Paenibacillus donghaensis]|uniref:Uncharacterized protein n=1 Tax=Paenibacillus donghaensis TaxID=414771 RepID=A0A2Z2KFM1_9BACL|nr:hypothetical protein [Paenibacillus donghaensis]ASA20929.1 hypothetical protein B9T62_09115 [Paenibacillus donghaensis]